MRLRQLSRKLGVHPDKILTVLADSGQELENEANSKLTEEQVSIIEATFPPEPEKEPESETTDEALTEVVASVPVPEEPAIVQEEEAEPINEVVEEESEAKVEMPDMEHLEVPFGPPSHTTSQVSDITEEETPSSSTDDVEVKPEKVVIQLESTKPDVKVYNAIEEDEEFINAELIKTEKPVLEGLKVLGKIELPEPKKPVEKTEEEKEKEEEEKEKRKDSKRRNGRHDRGRNGKGRNQRERLSPLEYERQKAQKLAKRKKLEAQKKLKQKKEQHYKENLEVKAKQKRKQPAKPKKVTVKREEAMAPLPINGASRQEPKVQKAKKTGAIKRFWGWLNGNSDKF